MQKLVPKTAGLKLVKIGHVDRVHMPRYESYIFPHILLICLAILRFLVEANQSQFPNNLFSFELRPSHLSERSFLLLTDEL